jgi:hypothetical protein
MKHKKRILTFAKKKKRKKFIHIKTIKLKKHEKAFININDRKNWVQKS